MKLSIIGLLYLTLLGSCNPIKAQSEFDLQERNNPHARYYHSSNVVSPKVNVTKSGEPLAPGYLFIAPQNGLYGPMIMTDSGDLVWSGTRFGFDVRKQQLNGEDVLTIYDPYLDSQRGFLYGSTLILDSTYTIINTVCPELGLYIPFSSPPPQCQGDIHEQAISPDGTLLITAYNVTQTDLTSIGGGPNGWVVEGQFYELAMNGTILFSWHSLDHVPVSMARDPVGPNVSQNATTPFDYFHINTVQKWGNQYMINSRNTWACFLINPDGSIAWTFNGYDGGDFGPLPNAPTGDSQHLYAYQHQANIESIQNGVVTLHLFNNDENNPGQPGFPSTGFVFLLDTVNNSSQLVTDYYDPTNPVYSVAEGSFYPQPNGNGLVGYGNVPVIKEFGTSNTDVRMTFQYIPGIRYGSYRAYRDIWTGYPTTNPSVAILNTTGMGYVSWNGATGVTRYVIKAGASGKLKQVSQIKKKGFETAFKLPTGNTGGNYLQVVAYNGTQLLGTSAITQYQA